MNVCVLRERGLKRNAILYMKILRCVLMWREYYEFFTMIFDINIVVSDFFSLFSLYVLHFKFITNRNWTYVLLNKRENVKRSFASTESGVR